MTRRSFAVGLLISLWAPGLAAQTIYFYQRGYVAGGREPASRLTDAALAAFRRRRPEVDVRLVGVPWRREGDLKLRAALLNRRRIDLFRLPHDQLADFLPAGRQLLSPVGPYLTEADRADFGPGVLAAVTHDGRVMAWPLWSTTLSLIVNVRLAEQAGLALPAPEAPWTWEEFVGALGRMSELTDAAGRSLWGLTAAARPPLFEWSPLLAAHAGEIFIRPAEPTSATWTFAPGLTEGLERVAELRRLGLTPRSFGTDDQPAVQEQFLAGRAGFILSTPALIRTLAARSVDFRVLPPPTGALGRPITTGALGCIAVVAHPEAPERTEAAHALARYLTSAEVAEDAPGWYLATPARASVTAFAEDPVYADLMRISRTAIFLAPPGGVGFLESTIIPAFQAAILGDVPAAEALAAVERAYARRALR